MSFAYPEYIYKNAKKLENQENGLRCRTDYKKVRLPTNILDKVAEMQHP